MRGRPIYLDNQSTTRTDPRVVEAMLPFFSEHYGNAASVSHSFGWEASEAVELARDQVARAVGAQAREIIFTSGATESNNLAIKGVAEALAGRGNHLVTAASEHLAVLDPMKRLARQGFELTIVPCDDQGMVDPAAVLEALTDRTILVSIMTANNEVGTINPIGAIAKLCGDRGIVFHTDAAQAVGKIAMDVEALPVDLLSISAHKFHGPKGIGALYIRRREPRVRLRPQLDGGGHERGLRSGTLPVPLVVGMGLAAEIAVRERLEESSRLLALRERLHQGIARRLPGIRRNGHPSERLPGNLNISFPGVDGEALMMAMRDIAVSSGAACSSTMPEPSHVLVAMGLDEDMARSSLRFGLGRFTTAEEIDVAIDAVALAVDRLRSQNIAWTTPDGARVDFAL